MSVLGQIVIGCVVLVISWILLRLYKYLSWVALSWRVAAKFPQPPHHWFWGVFPQVRKYGIVELTDRRLASKEWTRNFISWRTFLTPLLQVVHPVAMKDILRTAQPKQTKWGGYGLVTKWIGDGLLSSNGEKWERNRKLLTPAFHFNVLKSYMPLYNKAAEAFMKNISQRTTNNRSVDVFGLSALCTLDVILQCAFSYKGDIQEEGATHPYVKAVTRTADLVASRGQNPFTYSDFIFNLTPDGREFTKLCSYMHNFAYEIIDRRSEILLNSKTDVQKRNLDFLDILLTARYDNGEGLTRDDVRHEVDNFMFAGHDTTASATAWSLYALAKHPEWQDHVRKEVASVLGDKEEVAWEDIAKLKQTTMFLREVLRMYCPVPNIGRILESPTVIDGVEVPAGFRITISIYGLHHNPDVWDDPYTFNPERFADDNYVGHDPYKFVPFSAGPRNCIGQNFALYEEKVIISRFVQQFDIEVDETHDVKMVAKMIMRSKDGIWLKFAPRK